MEDARVDAMDLNATDARAYNDFQGYLRFKFTWVYKQLITCPAKFILLITGNQFGKTGSVARSFVDRILGWHRVPKKNVVYFECESGHVYAPFQVNFKDPRCKECGAPLKMHERSSRVFRFCAETQPGQSHNTGEGGKSAEVKNTQYPEFKKWLPPFLIKKDITFRNTSMIIKDPYGGDDIIVEFVSYNQSTQSVAGQQRLATWEDEAPPPDFHEEQLPRLLAEDGDLTVTYTPVDRSSWLFDEMYDNARLIYRTKAVVDYLKQSTGNDVQRVERTENPSDIVVIQAATDDNPVLLPGVIDGLFRSIGDPDVLGIRRYGIFKQLSGRIFKDFDYRVHFISREQYFPDGIPHDWVHARGIDYHPQTDWHCGFASLSPQNELFIWGELRMSPERYTTKEIAHEVAVIGKDYKFRLNLVDPLAEATKKDTVSVLEDLNRAFYDLKKEGIGFNSYWNTWDTKGERGRDAIHERLKNSKECKRPFNNKVQKDGVVTYLPTVWVLSTCKVSAEYMKNWRWEEWANSRDAMAKDKKNTPEQKYSHMNMVWEALLKETAFKSRKPGWESTPDRNYGAQHFKGRR